MKLIIKSLGIALLIVAAIIAALLMLTGLIFLAAFVAGKFGAIVVLGLLLVALVWLIVYDDMKKGLY